jgi:hypothetical protein
VALAGVVEQIAEESLELLALRHVSEAFETAGADRLATTAILEALVDRDDGPWAEWWGRDVAEGRTKAPARRLGGLLKAFGIEPGKMRIGEDSVRGYMREGLTDAVDRHVPLGNGTNGTHGTPLASTVPLVPSVPSGNGRPEIAGLLDVVRANGPLTVPEAAGIVGMPWPFVATEMERLAADGLVRPGFADGGVRTFEVSA